MQESKFSVLQTSLPDLDVVNTEGFSPTEIDDLKEFAADNEALIWERVTNKKIRINYKQNCYK